MPSEVSGVSSKVFHRSTWKEMNTQEGFNMLETWVRTTALTADHLVGAYHFINRFELEGHETLLANLYTHTGDKAEFQKDLISIANAQVSVAHCTFGSIVRATMSGDATSGTR